MHAARWLFTLSVALSVGLLSASRARADGPPDVVTLKNGGMLRGTIEEHEPGRKVVIVLASGERRTIPASEFDYAGPTEKQPKAPAATPPPTVTNTSPGDPIAEVKTAEAEVTFTSTEPGLTVFMKAGEVQSARIVASDFRRLCTTPCTVKLPVGQYHLTVSRDSNPLVRGTVVNIEPGKSSLDVGYKNNAGSRKARVILVYGAIGGGVAYSALVLGSSAERKGSGSTHAYVVAGLVTLFVVGFSVGKEDDATFRWQTSLRVAPTLYASPRGPGVTSWTPGLGVLGRF